LAGPAVNLSYRDRNLFRGGELFIVNLNGGFETYIGSSRSGFSSYRLGTDARLSFPRFVVPFKSIRESDAFIPKTHIKVGFDILSRLDFYTMNTVGISYGYSWKESLYKSHELNPISITYVELGNVTKRFTDLLDRNLLLRKGFEEQFIVGSTYSYIFNNVPKDKMHTFFFNGNVDLSGNTISLLDQVAGNSKKGTQTKIFGAPYAQYARFDFDFRHYYKIGRHYKFVSRLITGVGLPYGNSDILPYNRQFFAGGVNSVRAFPARSLGPGRYRPSSENENFFEQGGDIRFETNFEFRFDITSIIKGALFTDAGNVWLMNKHPELPGAQFDPAKFLTELGWGAGFGLRFDASIFVLRTDLAFPLSTPYGSRNSTTATQSLFGGSNSFLLNVAIGYPF
jgi:outer membrane protein assembly factor BamA